MRKEKVESVFILSNKPNEQRENRLNHSKHSNLLYVHFFFLYYLLLSPFRLKKVENGGFELHCWMPQKILCGLNVVFANLSFVTWMRQRFGKLRSDSAVSFLLLLAATCGAGLRVVMFIGFWRKKRKYLKLANYLSFSQNILPYHSQRIESTKFLILFHIYYGLYAITRWFLGVITVHIWDWSPTWLYRRWFAQARYTYFLANNPGNYTTAPELATMTGSDHFLTGVYAIQQLSLYVIMWFTHAHLLVLIFSLWAPVTEFARSVYNRLEVVTGKKRKELKREFDLIFEQFNALKDLSILLGEAIGDLIPFFFGLVIFNYPMSIEHLLLLKDVAHRVAALLDFIHVMGILILSAEVVRKMEWFKTWLLDQRKEEGVDQNKIEFLSQAVEYKSVAVNAAGMFNVDYSLLGTVGGLALTFFIVRLQNGAARVF